MTPPPENRKKSEMSGFTSRIGKKRAAHFAEAIINMSNVTSGSLNETAASMDVSAYELFGNPRNNSKMHRPTRKAELYWISCQESFNHDGVLMKMFKRVQLINSVRKSIDKRK